jgi:hypothetical protein
LFDTKYRNNRYSTGLGCFVSLDLEGNTHLLASSSLSKSEDKGTSEWIFNEFSTSFGASPMVIVTDGDATMADTLKAEHCTYSMFLAHIQEFSRAPTPSFCV